MKGSFLVLPPPPSHQPARQLDQTVGKFETRPRTSSARTKDVRAEFFNASCSPRLTLPEQATLGKARKRPIVLAHKLINDVAVSKFWWQHFPGVGFHFQMGA